MIGSLFAGISGLNSNSTALNVIADNIANVNTTAYKSNRPAFANVLSQSLNGAVGSNGVGRGVVFRSVNPQWTQGTLENTGSPTDLAISGKGFFMVTDGNSVTSYTRAGEFFFEENGRLVNTDGFNLMGFQIDANGNPSDLTGISIPGQGYSPPEPTTELGFDINLDSRTADGESYYATQSVYDSLGNAVPLTLTFTKQVADQTWSVAASTTAPNGPVTINAAGNVPVVFDEDGMMTLPAADQPIAITLANGADTPLTVSWDLYDVLGASYNDLSGFASQSATTFQNQNGYAAGVLRTVSVNDEGIVSGTYSNGQLVPLYQIALADFPSYEGLTKLGRNLYVESVSSGQPMPGIPGNGRMGSIAPSAIEMSNVDLAQEFVKMITTQRAFQANSRVITTSDEILAELINIKR